MAGQSYQEVRRIIEKDLRKLTNKKLNEIDFQEYFYDLKQKNPERYERLTFNMQDDPPFSSDLEEILRDLRGSVIGKKLYIIKKKK